MGGLLERAGIGLVIYTGALHDDTMGDFVELRSQAVKRGIPCLTSIDTALAAVALLDEGLSEDSTELVDGFGDITQFMQQAGIRSRILVKFHGLHRPRLHGKM